MRKQLRQNRERGSKPHRCRAHVTGKRYFLIDAFAAGLDFAGALVAFGAAGLDATLDLAIGISFVTKGELDPVDWRVVVALCRPTNFARASPLHSRWEW